MLNRRGWLAAAGALPMAMARAQGAAPKRRAHVAYVWMFESGPSAPYLSAYRDRLRELGWVEGDNLQLSLRSAGGDPVRLDAIMVELVAARVDVILAVCTPEARAARKATTTTPIVMAATGDPVAAGLVESLARPNTNVTGVSTLSLPLSARRVALLKEAMPRVTQATVIWNPERPDNRPEVQTMRTAAERLGIRLRSAEVRSREELDDELEAIGRDGTQALLDAGDALVTSQLPKIVARAAQLGLPAMYEDRVFVEGGGLMSYGVNLRQMHRRGADYTDRILKGARPAEMPIEQPTRFEFVLNRRVATAQRLNIPRSVWLQADEVLE